jgi:hypothetical protein
MLGLRLFKRARIRVGLVQFQIPSDPMLHEVLAPMNRNDRCALLQRNNALINDLPRILSEPLKRKERDLWKQICIETEQSFEIFEKTLLECQWYCVVDSGGSTSKAMYHHSLDLSTVTKKWLTGQPLLENQWAKLLDNVPKSPLVKRFAELEKAERVLNYMIHRIKDFGHQSDKLASLLGEMVELRRQEAYLQKDGIALKEHWGNCSHCKRSYTFSKGKKHPLDCGLPDCKKETKRLQKAIERTSKVSPEASKAAYPFVPVRRGRCQGERLFKTGCIKTRCLNEDNLCQKCNEEIQLEKEFEDFSQ